MITPEPRPKASPPARAAQAAGALLLALSLSCAGGGGGGAASPTISSFGAAKSPITAGTSTTLSAVYTDGQGTVDHGVGALASGGSAAVSPGWDTTYTLTVSNGGGQSASRSTVVQVVPPPVLPVITAPASLLPGQAGALASVPAQDGCTFTWTIQGGSFIGLPTGSSVHFTAGSAGSVVLDCSSTNAAGTTLTSAKTTIPILTTPQTPVIAAPAIVTANLPGSLATAVPQPGSTLVWTISGGLFDVGNTGSSVTFTAAPGGSVILGCRAVAASGASSATALATCLIAPAPLRPVISAPTVVSAGLSNLVASVPPQIGCSFAWTITGGSIDTGQNGSRITFTSGPAGTVVLTCVATNTAGTSSPQGVALIPIVPMPSLPTISAPAFVTAGQPGYTASTAPQPGCSYAWTIGGGSFTSAATGNAVTFTPGAVGTVDLACVVTNAAGTVSPPATAASTILPFPTTPVISAPTTVNLGATGLAASVPVQAGCTFAWTITGGSITSGANATAITFTAGSVGNLILTCIATNAAGTSSAPGMAIVNVISTPVSTIAAPAVVTGGVPGYQASVPVQPGCTYVWTLSGGTLTGGSGTATITFTPAASGNVGITCVVTNAAGTSSPVGSATCTIAPMPVTPLVTAPASATANLGGYVASVPIQAGSTYAWTIVGGSITAGAGTPSVTFTPGAAGTLTLGCVVKNAAATSSAPGTATVAVVNAPVSTLTAPTSVTASLPGYTASVAPQPGCTYTWTLAGGSITSGAGSTTLTFTPGPAGTVNLSCVVTNAAGTASLPGTAVCLIVPAPLVPIITSPGSATTGQGGYGASAPAQTGATYAWTITGGTITSGNGTNAIVFTAGGVGTLTLGCVATNPAGTASASGSASVNVISAPVSPVTAPSSVTASQSGYPASVPAQAGSSYAWTISNGIITSASNASSIIFTAGATGTVGLSCIVTNSAGTASLPGTASCTIVPPPPVPVILAPADVTSNQAGYSASAPVQAGSSYAWGVANGTLTAGNGTATITFTAGGAGTVSLTCTITNSAGTSSTLGSANCNIHPVPSAPISAPAFVTANQPGYLASVPTQGGCSYVWTISGGTITSGGNTSIATFTPAGSGTLTLGCVVTNLAGTPSAPGSATCSIVPPPLTPVVTAPAFVTAIAPGYVATTPAQAGCTFSWTVLGGTLSSGNGTNSITFTPGTAGTVTISCVASNSAGTGSAPGSATSAIVALPVINSFTAAPATITSGNAAILSWSTTGATSLTIDNGVGNVTGQLSKNVSPSTGTTYTLTATNDAGTAVTAQASVAVVPPPVITSFTAAPASIGYAATSTLNPAFSGGTGTIDHGIGTVSTGATVTTGVLTVTTTYTLSVTNTAGTTVTASATVTVAPAPAPGAFTATGTPGSKRLFHSGTTLANGTVLIAGGSTDLVNGLLSAEIYTPGTGSFAPTTGAMTQGRFFHTATILSSGKVLLLGGIRAFPGAPAGAEIFDPATGLFTATLNPPLAARAYHTATLLQSGKVLIVGGTTDFAGALASAELFDPATQTFTATGPMGTARRQATATLLQDGRVLIAGGSPNGSNALASAELYDPTLGTFTATTGTLGTGRFGHSAALLPSGTVLIAGGSSGYSTYLASAELFNPVAKTFGPTSGNMVNQRYWSTCTSLPTGNVLFTGGTGIPNSASAEVYDLASGLFKATVFMVDGRYGHVAAALSAGKVLLSGGQTASGTVTAEIFQ